MCFGKELNRRAVVVGMFCFVLVSWIRSGGGQREMGRRVLILLFCFDFVAFGGAFRDTCYFDECLYVLVGWLIGLLWCHICF